MPPTVYRVATVLCVLVAGVPLRSNLGLVLVFWTLLTGRLLGSRGAVIPALSALGLEPAVTRRTWAAVGHGAWSAKQVLANWQAWVAQEGAWQPHRVGGYVPVAADVTGFWRPHLQRCRRSHSGWRCGSGVPPGSAWGCRWRWSVPRSGSRARGPMIGRWCAPPG